MKTQPTIKNDHHKHDDELLIQAITELKNGEYTEHISGDELEKHLKMLGEKNAN